ncbi:hypothetical protein D3C71_1917900 [compost metagenome]
MNREYMAPRIPSLLLLSSSATVSHRSLSRGTSNTFVIAEIGSGRGTGFSSTSTISRFPAAVKILRICSCSRLTVVVRIKWVKIRAAAYLASRSFFFFNRNSTQNL